MKKIRKILIFVLVLMVFPSLSISQTGKKIPNIYKRPKNFKQWEWRTDYYKQRGDMKNLGIMVSWGQTLFPKKLKVWKVATNYYFKKKDYLTALYAAKKELALDNTPLRYARVGNIYHMGLKDYKKALEYYEKVKDNPQRHPDLDYYLADCYEKSGDKAKAVQYFNRYIKEGKKPKLLAKAKERIRPPPNRPAAAPTSRITSTTRPRQPEDPPATDCCYHIWAAGFNLGEATCLLKYTTERRRWEAADNTTLSDIRRAISHIQAAYSSCSKLNPAFPNWINRKAELERWINSWRKNPVPQIRNQTYLSMRSTYNWATSLQKQIVKPETQEKDGHPTCAKKYFQMGFLIAYAKQALKIGIEWALAGRNNWSRPVADGYEFFGKLRQVLEDYYLIKSGICVPIRDLRPKQRLTTIINTPIQKEKVSAVTDIADRLFTDLQRRIIDRCPGHVEVHPDEPKPTIKKTRFTVEYFGVRHDNFSGIVFARKRIKLNWGLPVTFTRLDQYRYSECNNYVDIEFRDVDYLGKKVRFYYYKRFKNIKTYIKKNGQTNLIKAPPFRLKPRDQVELRDGGEHIFINISPRCFKDASFRVLHGHDDSGKRVELQVPIFSAAIYWPSFKAMQSGQAAKKQKKN